MASEEIVWPVMEKGTIYEVTAYYPQLDSDFEVIGTFDKQENGVYFFTKPIYIKAKPKAKPNLATVYNETNPYKVTVYNETKPFPIPVALIKGIVDTNDFTMFEPDMFSEKKKATGGKTRRRRQRNKKSKRRRYKRKTRRL